LSILKDSTSLEAEKIIEKVFDAVKAFVQKTSQFDDITIVVIKKF